MVYTPPSRVDMPLAAARKDAPLFDQLTPLEPPELVPSLAEDAQPIHAYWMRHALAQAQLAAQAQEVPVGAVVVKNARLIAQAHNQTLQLQDPSAHAEMLALRAAAAALGNHRLDGCTLYVTLEPCCMCTGGIFQARLDHVVFGAPEPKTGAAGSVLNLYDLGQLNHHTRLTKGVLAQECAAVLQDFFAQRRQAHKTDQALNGLRDDALRSPASRFAPFNLPPAVGESFYEQDLPSLQGLRMHGLSNRRCCTPNSPKTALAAASSATDVEAGAAKPTFVCLAPVWHWSAYWRDFMARCTAQGLVCLAPDLPGWGPSDKPKKVQWHSLSQHVDILLDWLAPFGDGPVVLLAHNWQLPLALALQARLGDQAANWQTIGVNVDDGLQAYVTAGPASSPAGGEACCAALPLPKHTLQWLKGLPSLRGNLCWSDQLAKNARALPQLWKSGWDAAQAGRFAPAKTEGHALEGQVQKSVKATQVSALESSINAPYPDAGHAAALKAILAARFAPLSEGSLPADKALWTQAMALVSSLVARQALQFMAYEDLAQCLLDERLST